MEWLHEIIVLSVHYIYGASITRPIRDVIYCLLYKAEMYISEVNTTNHKIRKLQKIAVVIKIK